MNKEFKIGRHTIGANHKPFIVAEMSGNHNKSLETALKIVEAAAKSGAHALKLQTYTPDTLTINSKKTDFMIQDPGSLWAGRNLYELYGEAYTPWEWHEPIFKKCQELGMECFSTPFDDTAVDFLEKLGAPCYKIASFENNHLPLIRKAAQTGKPLIISTGLSTLADLQAMVKTVQETGNKNLLLLKCTSSYPASPKDTNILTIPHLAQMFDCMVGLSDHTMGVGVSVASVALGACFIEKHFTMSRAEGGVDSAFSLEPEEMKSLVIESERAWEGLGKVSYEPTEKEKKSLIFKRSIYVTKAVKKGERLTSENVRIIRPGYGLSPKYIDWVMNGTAAQDMDEGTALQLHLVNHPTER